jgi:hypothetical protein
MDDTPILQLIITTVCGIVLFLCILRLSTGLEEPFDDRIDDRIEGSIAAQKIIRSTIQDAKSTDKGRMNGKAPGGQEVMGVPTIIMPPASSIPQPMRGSSGSSNRSIGPPGPSGPDGPEFLPSTKLEGGFKANGDPLVLNGVESDRGYEPVQKYYGYGYGSGVQEQGPFQADGSEDYKFIPETTNTTTMKEACRIYGYEQA